MIRHGFASLGSHFFFTMAFGIDDDVLFHVAFIGADDQRSKMDFRFDIIILSSSSLL